MDLKQLLLEQGPKIALAIMAAKQGGPAASAALMEGIQQGEMRQQQLARQQQMDQQAQEHAAFSRQNVEADNARLDQNAEMDRKQRAIALILQRAATEAETATDPAMAQQALQQTAQSAGGLFGVDPSQLMGVAPDLAPVISKRKQKQALDRYEALKKIYGEEAVASDSITDNGEQFKGMKPSQILAMAQMGATDASGQPAMPAGAKKSGLQILDLGGRKVVVDPAQLQPGQTFDDVPVPSRATAERDNEPLVAIMGPDGAPVLVPRSQAVGKRPASTREQGRPVQSGDANRIIDLDTSINDLNTLEQEIGTTGAASKIGAMLPNAVTEFTGWGSDAKQRQAVIDRVKQVIGKALEGGVLRKEDEYKYVKILPTIGDPPEVAKKKLEGLRAAIQQRRATTLEGLADAGFDTSKFAEAAKADPLGIR